MSLAGGLIWIRVHDLWPDPADRLGWAAVGRLILISIQQMDLWHQVTNPCWEVKYRGQFMVATNFYFLAVTFFYNMQYLNPTSQLCIWVTWVLHANCGPSLSSLKLCSAIFTTDIAKTAVTAMSAVSLHFFAAQSSAHVEKGADRHADMRAHMRRSVVHGTCQLVSGSGLTISKVGLRSPNSLRLCLNKDCY